MDLRRVNAEASQCQFNGVHENRRSAQVVIRGLRAVDKLSACGATIDVAARPAFDVALSHSGYLRLLWSVMGGGLPPETLGNFEVTLPQLSRDDHSMNAEMARGVLCRHSEWLIDHEARTHVRYAWRDFFKDYDLVLCPIMPTPAFEHDHRPMSERSVSVNGQPLGYFDQLFWAGLAVYALLPSTVMPVGLTEDGLPVGMQAMGPYLEDRTCIRFAELAEAVLGGFVAPPGYQE